MRSTELFGSPKKLQFPVLVPFSNPSTKLTFGRGPGVWRASVRQRARIMAGLVGYGPVSLPRPAPFVRLASARCRRARASSDRRVHAVQRGSQLGHPPQVVQPRRALGVDEEDPLGGPEVLRADVVRRDVRTDEPGALVHAVL